MQVCPHEACGKFNYQYTYHASHYQLLNDTHAIFFVSVGISFGENISRTKSRVYSIIGISENNKCARDILFKACCTFGITIKHFMSWQLIQCDDHFFKRKIKVSTNVLASVMFRYNFLVKLSSDTANKAMKYKINFCKRKRTHKTSYMNLMNLQTKPI